MTAFFYRSHAHVILENFLVPYLFNGKVVDPTREFEVSSFYVDQFGTDEKPDMARPVAKQFGIPIYDSITEALTLGGDSLAVDAVLLIGEHGTYPFNEKGQELYPKKRFFDEVVSVFQKNGRSVPVYSDKHLSHTWSEAEAMAATSKRLGFGLMAGSSVPLAQRIPPLEIPTGAKITEAVSIHGGPLERYGFHGLEVLQSVVGARKGGETGVESVQYLEGDSLWKASEAGLWSESLATEAMKAELGDDIPPLRESLTEPTLSETPPHGFLLNYRDGLRAIVLKIGSSDIRWNFACRIDGEPQSLATRFHVGPWHNRNLFKALSHAIQSHFRENRAPYPIERTLLVSGALEATIDSKIAGGKPIETPHLDVAYQARDFRAFREMGKTWEIITEETEEPEGIEPVGIP
ncbi:MAG: hypothetical protein KDN19_22590 [Verrucomicrobiae bacterium]|nr:hypothetical protein [Verrucomicrobiae bacterium]